MKFYTYFLFFFLTIFCFNSDTFSIDFETAKKNSMKDLRLARNIYKTATASMNAMDLIQNTDKEFDAIMAIQVPDIVPFENEAMKEKFYIMTKEVRSSL